MKLILWFSIILAYCVPISSFCSVDEDNNTIIPDASYVIYEGASTAHMGIPTTSKTATFYTFNGNAIKTIEHYFRFPLIQKLLDSQAPKPQPTDYQIRYWPAIQIGFGTKGIPGFFIDFFDKNKNRIKSLRVKKSDKLANFDNQLDISRLLPEKFSELFARAKQQKKTHIEHNKSLFTRFFDYMHSLFYRS